MKEGPILYFDGVCNLCQRSVQFVIRHDARGKVRFASLQSEAGKKAREALLQQMAEVPDSLILFSGGVYYTRSEAAIRLAGFLDAPWPALAFLRIFPRRIRDGVYEWIARKRYRWFGKQDHCMLPTPGLRDRFLS